MHFPPVSGPALSLLLFTGLLFWLIALVIMLTATAAILDTLRMVIDIAGIAPDIPLPVPSTGA